MRVTRAGIFFAAFMAAVAADKADAGVETYPGVLATPSEYRVYKPAYGVEHLPSSYRPKRSLVNHAYSGSRYIPSYRQHIPYPTYHATHEQVQLGTDVLFDSDKAIIKAEAIPHLEEVASIIRDTGKKVTVSAHCDWDASHDYNVGLAERRALAVFNWLVRFGNIPSKMIAIAAHGENAPIATNRYESGKSLNRRVEFRFHHSKTHEPYEWVSHRYR